MFVEIESYLVIVEFSKSFKQIEHYISLIIMSAFEEKLILAQALH